MNITRSINKALQRLGALLTMTTLAACGGGSSDNRWNARPWSPFLRPGWVASAR
jgi:hypothetical protein